MTGLTATAALLAFAFVGHNLVRLHAWHTVRGRPEPWQVHLPRRGHPQASRSTTGPLTRPHGPEADANEAATDQSNPRRSLAGSPRKPARKRSRDRETGPAAYGIGGRTAVGDPHDPHNDETPGRIISPRGGTPTAGSLGNPKRVVQGTTRVVRKGGFEPPRP